MFMVKLIICLRGHVVKQNLTVFWENLKVFKLNRGIAQKWGCNCIQNGLACVFDLSTGRADYRLRYFYGIAVKKVLSEGRVVV